MIDTRTCKVIVWGFKNTYHTHGHIHEGFFRAAKRMGRESYWTDEKDPAFEDYFSNALVITEHQAVNSSLPLRDGCLYAVHNLVKVDWEMGRNPEDRWSENASYILRDADVLTFGVYTCGPRPGTTMLDNGNMPLDVKAKVLEMLWATDIFPEDIEGYKATARMIVPESKNIYFIGSGRGTLDRFGEACRDNGVEFHAVGGWGRQRVSVEDNVRLVQESRFAPTLVDEFQTTHPYIPCRVLKNISYGRFGVTNSKYVNEFLGREVVFNPDTYELYRQAELELPHVPLGTLHRQMDWVAKYHTYLNRLSGLLEAVDILQGGGQ